MEPEPIDLSVLDPRRNATRFDAAVNRIAQRALEVRRLRRAVVRRGLVALALATAAGVVLWLSAPRPQPPAPQPIDVLDWATRDLSAADVLAAGGGHAE